MSPSVGTIGTVPKQRQTDRRMDRQTRVSCTALAALWIQLFVKTLWTSLQSKPSGRDIGRLELQKRCSYNGPWGYHEAFSLENQETFLVKIIHSVQGTCLQILFYANGIHKATNSFCIPSIYISLLFKLISAPRKGSEIKTRWDNGFI